MRKKEISIIIPVFNSSENLNELSAQIAENLKHTDYELVFVNDSSTDESWKIITQIIEMDQRVAGVNLRKNCGQDNSILAGLRNSSGDFVVIMDDDLQHSPADILILIEACKNGFDVCYANFKTKRQSILKNVGSKLNGFVARMLLSKPKNIYLSPFKAIKREIADEVVKYESPYTYIDGIILDITSNLTQVDVEHFERKKGRSNYTLKKSASVFFRLFTGFSIVPLRIATYLGLAITILGFAMIFKYLYDFFILEDFVEGWTTIVILIIFFGGLVLTTLGLIGEYLGRAFLSINKKPQYSIKKIVRNSDKTE
jgi:undecaprenyl-phosphate 4-deoxy-4-formamido-L-arabinose transferase